jgi:hypothetical protein
MAYAIAEPWKDAADFESATMIYIDPVECIAVVPACLCVRCRRSLHWMTCLRGGRTLQQ